MKDNFSEGSKQYAQFRPRYPKELFDHLLLFVKEKDNAWDCGTGNGQVAGVLAEYFKKVYATDISQQQIDEAVKRSNIYYSIQPAEKTSFIEKQFDLITVAQAIHWFRFDDFYAEVKRTLKPGGIIAVIGYGPVQTIDPLQDIIDHFYKNIIGPYWDAERHYIDELYQTIPFPFLEIKMPVFTLSYQWTLAQLIGYLNTWSAVKHYTKQHQRDPVTLIQKELSDAWPAAPSITFSFPLLTRIGS
jgi:ubiquinone/menaquinone biosynthesis C-methylase UbiE